MDRVAFGGMAEIYRAKTADAEGRLHLVAVKRVLGHLCEDEEFIQMLVDEAKITASLQHENIARIYEFCRTDREYFIAMEYVDGKDVRALLEKSRQGSEQLPEEHIARIGMEVGRALHAAHTQRDKDGRPLRIVHRDVSPSNVLLSYRGEVKLCDFGIAKATLTRVQTKTGVIKGKVKYMSPEQAMGRKLDHRSDLFSLGTLLYEMLTLLAPFQAPTEIELIFAVRDARKRPVSELRPTVNPVLEAIVEKAMARSRSQRYQSGEELAQALESFLMEFYPDQRRSQFGRFMRNAFTKEIDRELRMLEEFVIEGGKADDVGENLLADVLGPDAPYTQFTAAFIDGEGGVPGMMEGVPNLKDIQDLPTGPKPMPGVWAANDDLGEPRPRPAGVAVPIVDPALLPRQVSPMSGAGFRSELDAGWVSALATPPQPGAPPGDAFDQVNELLEPEGFDSAQGSEAPFFDSAQRSEAPFFDSDLHQEQTRILTRAMVGKSLHEASTRIFDLRNLPKEMQQALQPRQPAPENLAPLSGELHEAETAYLPRARQVDWRDEPAPPARQRSEPPARQRSEPPVESTAQVRLPRRPELRPSLAEDESEPADMLTVPGPLLSPEELSGIEDEPTRPPQRAPALAPLRPTGVRPRPDPPPLESGSVELSKVDVSFIDERRSASPHAAEGPAPATSRDLPEASVILHEEDLELLD